MSWRTHVFGCAAALFLVGCIGGGGDDPPAPAACTPSVTRGFDGNIETQPASASGAAAGGGLGKVLGGQLSVTDLATGNVVGQALTDDASGLVTVRACALGGPFLVTLAGRDGARYYDEGRDTYVDFPAGTALHALVDRWDEHVGVSPLTEAAYRHALANFRQDPREVAAGRVPLAESGNAQGLTGTQVAQSNAVVRDRVNALNVERLALASVLTLPAPLDGSAARGTLGTSTHAISAEVNGGLVKQAFAFNPTLPRPAVALAQVLAADLTDGVINSDRLDGQSAQPAERPAYDVAKLPQASALGAGQVAQQFASAAAAEAGLTIVEETFLAGITCFRDQVALLSNGEVRVRRIDAVNGQCPIAAPTAANSRLLRGFLSDVVALEGYFDSVLALKRDGSLWAWGWMPQGLGSAPAGTHAQPQRVSGPSTVTQVVRGTTVHARTAEGDVLELQGSNFVKVPELKNIVRLRVAQGGLFAIDTRGDVWAWGSGEFGSLGNGASPDATAADSGTLGAAPVARPTRMAGVSKVVDIALSHNGSLLALRADGTVLMWGSDVAGIFGRGRPAPQPLPVAVPGVAGIQQIRGGLLDGFYLLQRDGTLLYWGRGGSLAGYSAHPLAPAGAPTVVDGLGKVRAVSLNVQEFVHVHLPDGRYVLPGRPPEDVSALFR